MSRSRSEGIINQAAPLLEGALLFTFLAHGAAMLSMALLLIPGLPGVSSTTVAERAVYVGGHPWLWRLGWLPWQITAVSDLFLAVALLRTRWVPMLPAIVTLLALIIALIPDQTGQALWTWKGTALAQEALRSSDLGPYALFEAHTFLLIAGWGALGYLVGALCWTWCLVAAGTWSGGLTSLSIAAWGTFAFSTGTLLMAPRSQAGSWVLIVVSVGNAVGFLLLMLWLIAVSEAVIGRGRPASEHGHDAPWRHPGKGLPGRCYELLANSRFARAVVHLFPVLAMQSDITDVVYVNYLVDADHLRRFVVAPLTLQTLGADGSYAMLTFLSFRHHHFGPRCFGPFRKLWPSPIQSNWRIYVSDPFTKKCGVQFLTIAMSATRYAIAARLMAENVPMHVPAAAKLRWRSDDSLELHIAPGVGTAPDVSATFRLIPEPRLTHPWDSCFASWRSMLDYCVPQDRAMSSQPWLNRVTCQEISLNIPLDDCLPLAGTVSSKAAEAIVGNAVPVCFLVKKLSFRLLKEQFDLRDERGMKAGKSVTDLRPK